MSCLAIIFFEKNTCNSQDDLRDSCSCEHLMSATAPIDLHEILSPTQLQ